jgi:hypothetical protein
MLITNLRQQGVYGKEYTWYDFKAMDQMMDQGINMFRLNFRKSIKHLPLPTSSSHSANPP